MARESETVVHRATVSLCQREEGKTMTDTLRRWSITSVSSVGEEHGVPTKNGKWVLYADVERVLAENKRLQGIVAERTNIGMVLGDMASGVMEQEREQFKAALAAKDSELAEILRLGDKQLAAQSASLAQLQARVRELEGDSESLEQPSPLRVVDSTASDGTDAQL